MGHDVDMQATMKAKALLGAQKDKVKHIEAMPWSEVPEFCASLVGKSIASECLLFVILTAPRSGSARNAKWADIDLDKAVWTIPEGNIKGQEGKTEEFRIPLSDAALDVLRRVRPLQRDGLIFPSPHKGALSDGAMLAVLNRRGIAGRPHGFRSGFRDWCEHAGVEYLVAETCLAHTVESKVVRAYRRDDLLEKRRVAMQRWADHCSGKASAQILTFAGEA